MVVKPNRKMRLLTLLSCWANWVVQWKLVYSDHQSLLEWAMCRPHLADHFDWLRKRSIDSSHIKDPALYYDDSKVGGLQPLLVCGAQENITCKKKNARKYSTHLVVNRSDLDGDGRRGSCPGQLLCMIGYRVRVQLCNLRPLRDVIALWPVGFCRITWDWIVKNGVSLAWR